jgi:hypothetical protein
MHNAMPTADCTSSSQLDRIPIETMTTEDDAATLVGDGKLRAHGYLVGLSERFLVAAWRDPDQVHQWRHYRRAAVDALDFAKPLLGFAKIGLPF